MAPAGTAGRRPDAAAGWIWLIYLRVSRGYGIELPANEDLFLLRIS